MTTDYGTAVAKIEAALSLVSLGEDPDQAIVELLNDAKTSLDKGRFLDTKSLSKRWNGISTKTISNQRSAGDGPKFIRPVGTKKGSAIYAIGDVEAYEKQLSEKGN